MLQIKNDKIEVVEELWKDIKDYEQYQISNFGRIKRKSRLVKTKKLEINKEEKIFMKIHNQNIVAHLKNRQHTSGGYIWKYDDIEKIIKES